MAAMKLVIRSLAHTGVTVLLVEQNARMVLKLADRGYVLEVGRIVLTGEADTLLGSSEIQTAYLVPRIGEACHTAKSDPKPAPGLSGRARNHSRFTDCGY